YSVCKIVRGVDLDTVRTIVSGADTRVDLAGAWALMEVAQHTKAIGRADLELIAARKRIPPEVLEPVFDRMATEGYLVRDGDALVNTERGIREVRALAHAWSDWLNARLDADAGRPRSPQLRTAADAIAWRLLVEDLTNGLPVQARSKDGARV
ncbi:MFS transporter, partial [Kitasatospora sp. NPDC097691]